MPRTGVARKLYKRMMEKPTSLRAIKTTLAREGLAPRKSLGQNFLYDANIPNKIVAAGAVEKTDLVLEIGPGLGVLTSILIEQAGMVVAVEYDRGLFRILQENLATVPNLRLINQDFLQVDLPSLLEPFRKDFPVFKVIANLPYYITTPVLFKLIESGPRWGVMVFLVQKEVAERLCAGPGSDEYGAVTVMLNYYGTVEKVAVVPRTVFYPVPQVDSAAIRITPHPGTAELYPGLHRVVQAAFGQRRKTILNALFAGGILLGNTDKLGLAARLRDLGIDPERRGETLTLEEFLKIARIARVAP